MVHASCAGVVSLLLLSGLPAQAGGGDELVGLWRVQVNDKNRDREFEILRVEATKPGMAIDGLYGWVGSAPRHVTAAIDGDGQLTLVTPAKGILRARQTGPTSFDGTLQTKGGRSYHATLTLMDNRPGATESEVRQRAAPTPVDSEAPRADLKPGAVVHNPKGTIQILYFGGNDCPPCVAWRATELPKFKALPEYSEIKFYYVTKAIQAPVPVGWFPDEIKPLGPQAVKASGGRGGSSQSALFVDGKLAEYWFGSRGADELARMVRAIRSGQPLPGTPCLEWNAIVQCVKNG